MTLASSPPSSRCLLFRVCQTLRFLSSQFCRTQRSVFRQQFHPCLCTRLMTLASSPPSVRCSHFGTSVSSISFPSTCGWAVLSLLWHCCGGAVCWCLAISLPAESAIVGEVGRCMGVRWREDCCVGVFRTGPVAAGVRVYNTVSHL